MSQVQGRDDVRHGTGPMTDDERDELERLRRENEALRTRTKPRRRRIRWRSVTAAVLIVLGCLLVPVSLVAVWTDNEVSDTDTFVQTVGPLVDDPTVQAALTNRITATVFEYVDVQALADEAINALTAQGLPPELAKRLSGFTPALTSATTDFVRERVARLVASPGFESAWDDAVRVAHQQAVTVLSGDSQGVVVQGDTVYLQLGPFIDAAKERLSQAGLTAVDLVPEVNPTIPLVPADQLVRAQTAYDLLGSVATVLPWITLLLLVVGVYLARNRARAVVAAGLGAAVALTILAAGLLVARGVLVGAVPVAGAPAAAAGFDLIAQTLRDGGRVLLVLALVIALGGYLAGSSESAAGVRRWSTGLLHRIRGGPSATGPVGTWVRAHMRGLRVAACGVAVLVFVFLPQPSGVAILLIAVGLLVALGVIEFLGRPAADAPAAAG